MKVPQVTLPNMAKREDKEDYTTSVARHIFCNGCSVVFLVFLFCHVRQGNLGYFPFHLISVLFTGPSLHDFNLYRKFFTPSIIVKVLMLIDGHFACCMQPHHIHVYLVMPLLTSTDLIFLLADLQMIILRKPTCTA